MADVTGGASVPSDAGASGAAVAAPVAAPAAPSPIELSDDTLVRIKGTDQPIKFSDHVRGFQRTSTQAAQRAAALEKRVAEFEKGLKARDEELQRYRTALGHERKPDPTAELVNALTQKEYLTGQEAAQLVQHLMQQVQGTARQFDPTHQAILQIAQQVKALQDGMKPFQEERTQGRFKEKISKFVKDSGLPDEALDLAQEVYLAYQGDDLDQEFPSILSKRWEQISKAVRAADRAKLQKSREAAFVPGKGGTGIASKPLSNAFKSAKEIADSVWDGLSGEDA